MATAPSLSRADARLEFAIRLAEETNDAYAWLVAVNARYSRATNGQVPEADMAEMRVGLWRRADLLRGQYRSRAARLWVGQIVERTTAPLFRDELALGNTSPARTFYMMEAVKARTLLDQMHLNFVDLPAELKQQAATIEESIGAFADDSQSTGIDAEIALTSPMPIDEHKGRSVEERLRAIEALYAKANAGFSGVQSVSDLQDIQQALAPREALIEFAIPPDFLNPAKQLYAIAITRNAVFQADYDLTAMAAPLTGALRLNDEAPKEWSALGGKIVAARTAIQQGNDVEADVYLAQLHAILIAPLLKRGLDAKNFDRWVIVPHRLLHSVPWNALRDAVVGRRLIQDVALTVVPSASIWHRLVSTPAPAATSYLALANPRPLPDATLPALPEAETEADKIGVRLAPLDINVLKNVQATAGAFYERTPGKSIVHLATHGAFPAQNALDFHQFLLAPSAGHDGVIRAEDVRQVNLKSAFLVTLSICNGGIYRLGPCDEPYGLVPALFVAGVRNVIGTLWSINDLAGRKFMVDFYATLLELGPDQALRRAACRCIDAGWDIRRWAAFLITGPARTPSSA